jgi:hypothetical protein
MRRLMIVTWRKSPEEDSTLRLIGIASGGPPDVAENHDKYLVLGALDTRQD